MKHCCGDPWMSCPRGHGTHYNYIKCWASVADIEPSHHGLRTWRGYPMQSYPWHSDRYPDTLTFIIQEVKRIHLIKYGQELIDIGHCLMLCRSIESSKVHCLQEDIRTKGGVPDIWHTQGGVGLGLPNVEMCTKCGLVPKVCIIEG